MKRNLTVVLALMVVLLIFTAVQAQDGQLTPTPDSHAIHHPTAEATATLVPNALPDAGMGQMGGMDMHTMMQNMSSMIDTMLSMNMSDEMRAQMKQMRNMMDMMMSGNMMSGMDMTSVTATPESTGNMEMGTKYSVNDLAPMALAYYDGEEVYFVHPEASDKGVAQVLTDMMGTEVMVVPSLAEVPKDLLGNVYVFTNGIKAMGPLGFQPDVFDSVPGDEAYTPLRALNLVTWQGNAQARELTSIREILAAEKNGEVIIEQPGVVVNMPILVWPEGHR